MTDTRYTDPSSHDDATGWTAADQERIVNRAVRLPLFASIVATPNAALPVASTVHNTNTLLGHNALVGVITRSDDAASRCFTFRAIRSIDGKRTTITGVVLGQLGYDQVEAAKLATTADRARKRSTTFTCPSAPTLEGDGDAAVTRSLGHRAEVNPTDTRERRYE